MNENEISERFIGCAIEVHRHLGPGLLESVYEEALCYELSASSVSSALNSFFLWLPLRRAGIQLDGAPQKSRKIYGVWADQAQPMRSPLSRPEHHCHQVHAA